MGALERIEVLAGPQGTLFGASSQSGNLRLITRKPDPTGFSAGFNARFATTRGGAASASADAFVNIPFGAFSALRLVAYSDHPGGWVDNVAATFTPSAEVIDRNSAGYGPRVADADSVVSARNDGLVQDDWNDASYRPPCVRALIAQRRVCVSTGCHVCAGTVRFAPVVDDPERCARRKIAPA